MSISLGTSVYEIIVTIKDMYIGNKVISLYMCVSSLSVALLANDLIMSGTLIWSFRHLEHPNQSIISEDIGRARMVQQF